jgi:hypothetical protein
MRCRTRTTCEGGGRALRGAHDDSDRPDVFLCECGTGTAGVPGKANDPDVVSSKQSTCHVGSRPPHEKRSAARQVSWLIVPRS